MLFRAWPLKPAVRFDLGTRSFMRPGRIVLIIIALFGCSSVVSDHRMASSGPEPRAESFTQQQPPPPPPPTFIPFRSIEKRLVISEREVAIVGVLAANCDPVYSQFANFSVVSPDTPFVDLIDDSSQCATGSRFRFLVRVAPQRGDAGKYQVVICGNACGGMPVCIDFEIKVKKAQ
jgi:hypothetical protein